MPAGRVVGACAAPDTYENDSVIIDRSNWILLFAVSGAAS